MIILIINRIFGIVGAVCTLMLASVVHAADYRAIVIPVEMLPTYPITNINQLPQSPNVGVLSHLRFGFTTEPSYLRPGVPSKKIVTLVVVDVSTGGFIPNVNASFTQPRPELNTTSGGHEHENSIRPVGSFSNLSGNTGPSGFGLTTTYEAPEASGNLEFTFRCAICLDEINYIHVELAGLETLPPSAVYDLVGATPTHPDNHYGTTSFVAKLQAVAAIYYINYPNLPNNRLAFNDISLQKGGLFDIGATWTPPHSEHRNGTNVDMSLVPTARRLALRQLLVSVGIGGQIYVEGSHWHVRE